MKGKLFKYKNVFANQRFHMELIAKCIEHSSNLVVKNKGKQPDCIGNLFTAVMKNWRQLTHKEKHCVSL